MKLLSILCSFYLVTLALAPALEIVDVDSDVRARSPFICLAAAQSTETTTTVKVKGITCSTDLKMIRTNVEKLEGVQECKVGKRGATTSFVITYNPNTLVEEDLHAAIEGTASCKNPDERPYKVKQ